MGVLREDICMKKCTFFLDCTYLILEFKELHVFCDFGHLYCRFWTMFLIFFWVMRFFIVLYDRSHLFRIAWQIMV